MTVLRRFLLFARNILDKLILKLDPPTPINFKPFPELSITNCTVSGSVGIYTNAGSTCMISGNTCDGTSTGINIYDYDKVG